ncbi:MAG: MaoC family dehydratase N-terminal domain-containing protein, partial [Bifidobacteriaceae bacterium]|nr:MaoC family dehydratase N-terminal domain-containing protein [Bifidobacteriaceae bacterium]
MTRAGAPGSAPAEPPAPGEPAAPSPTPAEFSAGADLGPVEVLLTRADLVRYAGASGDFNPIHWSDEAARKADLPGVIAHGMLTMGRAAQ